MTHSNDRLHRFKTTRWSLVMQHDVEGVSDSRDALVDLCLRYRYPVYAYVRRCGHPPQVAHEVTHRFLQDLLGHHRQWVDRKKTGQFRTYLLECIDAFLADDTSGAPDEPAMPELSVAAPDLELRNQNDNAQATSPEDAFQRSFALEIFARAFARLREEAHQTGHLSMYEALERYLTVDPAPGEYEELAVALRVRPLVLVVALKRLRQRFRELTGKELADTLESLDALEAEQQTLRAILHRHS